MIEIPINDAMTDEWLVEAQAGLRAKLPDDSGVAQIGLVMIAALVEARGVIETLKEAINQLTDTVDDEDDPTDAEEFFSNFLVNASAKDLRDFEDALKSTLEPKD